MLHAREARPTQPNPTRAKKGLLRWVSRKTGRRGPWQSGSCVHQRPTHTLGKGKLSLYLWLADWLAGRRAGAYSRAGERRSGDGRKGVPAHVRATCTLPRQRPRLPRRSLPRPITGPLRSRRMGGGQDGDRGSRGSQRSVYPSGGGRRHGRSEQLQFEREWAQSPLLAQTHTAWLPGAVV